MSKDCNFLVRPPGITAIWKCFAAFILNIRVKWGGAESIIRMDLGLKNESRLFPQISLSQIVKYSSFIQPFSLACTTIPSGNFSFGIVFLLNIIIGESFPPSEVTERTTVKLYFSATVVIIFRSSVPFWFNSEITRHIKAHWNFIYVSNLILFYANNSL